MLLSSVRDDKLHRIGNVSFDLLLAALAIMSRTCIFYFELGNMVGFAMDFLVLAFPRL